MFENETIEIAENIWGEGGPYVVRELLAGGGEGEAGIADNQASGEHIFLKEYALLTPASSSREENERFRNAQAEVFGVFKKLARRTFVVEPYHFFLAVKPKRYFQTFPLLRGNDLASYLKHGGLTFDVALFHARAVAAGLASLHEGGLAMIDLKPENVFMAKRTMQGGEEREIPSVIDLTSAWKPGYQGVNMDGDQIDIAEGTRPARIICTAEWRSPELLYVEHERAKNPEKMPWELELLPRQPSDVFIAGRIIYELLSGKPPLDGNKAKERAQFPRRIFAGEKPASLLKCGVSGLTAAQDNAILSMLELQPGDRPTMREVHQLLLGGALLPSRGRVQLELGGTTIEVDPDHPLVLNPSTLLGRGRGRVVFTHAIGLIRHYANVGWALMFNDNAERYEIEIDGATVNNMRALHRLVKSGSIVVKCDGQSTRINYKVLSG